jgi:RNA polymerase sigma factor (sigma-70 family)
MPQVDCSRPSKDNAEILLALRRAISRTCPAFLRQERDDLVQAAFVRVLQAARRGEDHRARSNSYLREVAFTTIADAVRRETTQRAAGLASGSDAPEVAGPRRRPELSLAIREGLETLVSSRRVAVQLYLQGYSREEAARILWWNERKVDNAMLRGLADLRRSLAAKGLWP